MAKQKQRENETNGIRHDLESPEGMLPPPEPEVEEPEEQDEPVKLKKWPAVYEAISEIDGDTTYRDIVDRVKDFMAVDDKDRNDDALWNAVDSVMMTLQSLGQVKCDWEVRVHPLVPRLGKPSK